MCMAMKRSSSFSLAAPSPTREGAAPSPTREGAAHSPTRFGERRSDARRWSGSSPHARTHGAAHPLEPMRAREAWVVQEKDGLLLLNGSLLDPSRMQGRGRALTNGWRLILSAGVAPDACQRPLSKSGLGSFGEGGGWSGSSPHARTHGAAHPLVPMRAREGWVVLNPSRVQGRGWVLTNGWRGGWGLSNPPIRGGVSRVHPFVKAHSIDPFEEGVHERIEWMHEWMHS
jgi:hypothetical protein